jgi:chemotaxis protein histidine kinase CheA
MPHSRTERGQRKHAWRQWWYGTAHSKPGKKFVEVPEQLAPMVKDFARGKVMHDALDIYNQSHEHFMSKALHRAKQRGLPPQAVEQARSAKRAFDKARHLPSPETKKILASFSEQSDHCTSCMGEPFNRRFRQALTACAQDDWSERFTALEDGLQRIDALLTGLHSPAAPGTWYKPSLEHTGLGLQFLDDTGYAPGSWSFLNTGAPEFVPSSSLEALALEKPPADSFKQFFFVEPDGSQEIGTQTDSSDAMINKGCQAEIDACEKNVTASLPARRTDAATQTVDDLEQGIHAEYLTERETADSSQEAAAHYQEAASLVSTLRSELASQEVESADLQERLGREQNKARQEREVLLMDLETQQSAAAEGRRRLKREAAKSAAELQGKSSELQQETDSHSAATPAEPAGCSTPAEPAASAPRKVIQLDSDDLDSLRVAEASFQQRMHGQFAVQVLQVVWKHIKPKNVGSVPEVVTRYTGRETFLISEVARRNRLDLCRSFPDTPFWQLFFSSLPANTEKRQ